MLSLMFEPEGMSSLTFHNSNVTELFKNKLAISYQVKPIFTTYPQSHSQVSTVSENKGWQFTAVCCVWPVCCVLYIKPIGPATPIHLCFVYGCFHTTTAKHRPRDHTA